MILTTLFAAAALSAVPPITAERNMELSRKFPDVCISAQESSDMIETMYALAGTRTQNEKLYVANICQAYVRGKLDGLRQSIR